MPNDYPSGDSITGAGAAGFNTMATVRHRYVVEGRQLCYRDAGPPGAPLVVLFYGFPASSFMFRDLIPLLAGQYHVIAPDRAACGE
jgi:pimeloyl-ACP methyl ester carboxylesterase